METNFPASFLPLPPSFHDNTYKHTCVYLFSLMARALRYFRSGSAGNASRTARMQLSAFIINNGRFSGAPEHYAHRFMWRVYERLSRRFYIRAVYYIYIGTHVYVSRDRLDGERVRCGLGGERGITEARALMAPLFPSLFFLFPSFG